MKRCITSGFLTLALLISGCGSHAVYLRSGTECILEKPVTVTASVPGADGNLVPHSSITLPEGTLFKYGGK